MTMTPDRFHDLLRDAVADEPPGGDVAGDVAVGRRMLRRRRGLAVTGAAALVVAGAVSAQALGLGPGDERATVATPQPAPGVSAPDPDDHAELVQRCHDGNQSDRATSALFDAGPPVVKALARTEHQITLALEARDGRHWAECFIHLDDQEFASGMTVWDATGTSRDETYGWGPGCAMGAACDTFAVTWVDRRPEAVAAAEFLTADGVTTTVRSHDGYLVLEYLGELPDGQTTVPGEGLPMEFTPIRQVTFLDADGEPIAAERNDGTGDGPDGERVGDLPSLRDYPAQRGNQAIY